jgi:hypothetical protein
VEGTGDRPDFLESSSVTLAAGPTRGLFELVMGIHPDEVTQAFHLRVRSLIRPPVECYLRVFHPVWVESEGRDLGLVPWSWLADGAPPPPDIGLDDWLETNRSVLAARRVQVVPQIGMIDRSTTLRIARGINASIGSEHCYFFWHDLPVDRSVYSGSMDAIGEFVARPSNTYVSPTAWWDAGNAWFVVTHPEADSTYVGGSGLFVEHLLADPELESALVDGDADVTGSSIDTVYDARRGS